MCTFFFSCVVKTKYSGALRKIFALNNTRAHGINKTIRKALFKLANAKTFDTYL